MTDTIMGNIRTAMMTALAVLWFMPSFIMAQHHPKPDPSTVPELSLAVRKCSPRLRQGLAMSPRLVPSTIYCDNSDSVASVLRSMGTRATVLTPHLLTSLIPAEDLPAVSQRHDVRHIDAFRRAYPTMDHARVTTLTDDVHRGIGLDTPYTGRGVIIGVIDVGIEYQHLSFLDSDGRPRVLAIWDRTGYSEGLSGDPTTVIPLGGDTLYATGHGTHVAGICAGSRIEEHDLYGIAPDANLILVSSELNTNEVMEEIQFISDFARQQGKPWVINTSFGELAGPHDGRDYNSQYVDSLLNGAIGCHLVTSAGNSGDDNGHISHTFTSNTDTVNIIIEPGAKGVYLELWCQEVDSLQHVGFRPFTLEDDLRNYQDSAFWEGRIFEEIAPYNNKQTIVAYYRPDSLGHSATVGLELWGETGVTIHGWVPENRGTITSKDERCLTGDNDYSVTDFFGNARSAITVGAYVSNTSFVNLSGRTLYPNIGTLGSTCKFTGHGPTLCGVPKPTITAPGSVVCSAISSYTSGFNPDKYTNVGVVHRYGTAYYYGAKQGTSMSTPIVTGVVALMLEANPYLPSSAIYDIICQSALHDEQTGDSTWDPLWGYGKINAYDALRLSLARAATDGIPAEYSSPPRVTVNKGVASLQLLFGQAQSDVRITLFDSLGRTITQTHHPTLTQGEEINLPTSHLPHGLYLLDIKTRSGTSCHKLTL